MTGIEGLALRPMREVDLDLVFEIEQQAYPFPWTMGIFRDCLRVGYSCWVLEREEHPIAYAVMSVAADEAHILNICVIPSLHGQGIGHQLLEQMVALARRRGVDTVLLEVRPSNKAAVRMYEKAGFCEVGLRRGYYPGDNGREDALIMARSI